MNKLTKSELIEKLEDLPERGTVINVDTLQDVYIEAVKHCVSLINNTEIIPDPVPAVDTELEEAKKLVGTWVKYKGNLNPHVAFRVLRVYRDGNNDVIVSEGENYFPLLEHVEPFPLPTAAKWRCMKTDVENSLTDRLLRLNGSYDIGWYDVAKQTWCIADNYIDLSCYQTFEWLEIPRGE